MSRKNHVKPKNHGEGRYRSNRENRGGRILKVWRRIANEDTSLIVGSLSELVSSSDLPGMKIRQEQQVFIFDPRLMPQNFNAGFMSGFQFGKVVAGIERAGHIPRAGYAARIGKISIMGNGKTILAEVESDKLLRERKEVFGILGDVGLREFTQDGRRKNHRKLGRPKISLGSFNEPITHDERDEVEEVIKTGIIIGLTSGSESLDIQLGDLEIKDYQQH